MGAQKVNVEATKRLQEAIDAERDNLSVGVANALATWSEVETMLTFVFVAILDRSRMPMKEGAVVWDEEPLQRRMGHTVMNAVVGFKARLDVVSAVVDESDLNADLKRLWPGLAKRVGRTYNRRHKVAHFIFDIMQQRDGTARILVAPIFSTVTSMEAERLNRAKLDELANDFHEIGLALRWFMRCIEIKRGRLRGPRTSAPNVIRRILDGAKE